MAIPNISNLPISASFQQILQISGSVIGTATGSQVDELTITASNAIQADTANTATTAVSANSASYSDTALSASHALNADDAISASYAVTASHALNTPTVDTGSLLTTASISDATITFEKGDASTFAITVDNVDTASIATSASYAVSASHADSATSASRAISSSRSDSSLIADNATEIFIIAKNVQGVAIPKEYAVHSAGVTGENVNITTASYDDSSLMPAIGITQTAINAGAVGEVIITGRLKDVNTSNLVAGANVYVNGDGNLTATRPTGSALVQNIGTCAKVNATEGEIIVMGAGRSNDVPNIATGAVWVGNSDQVATAVQTGSLSVATASLALDVISTANLNITSISASSANFQSASIGFLESVTGSAKIIGDAFIILNNDTPTERYAGIVVQDSGSGAPNTTASFEWDGQTNDWFYHYEGDDPTDFSIAMFGPEYSTKGSPVYLTNNTIPKGDGGHHLNDSNITDDGSTIVLGSNSEVTGSLGVTGTITGTLSGQASTAISASHAIQADSALTADSATTATTATTANTASYVAAANVDGTVATATSASYVAGGNVDGAVASATSASHALNADDAISSSYATSASIAEYEKNLNSNSGSIQLWQGSKTEYDAISGSASNEILYFVIE